MGHYKSNLRDLEFNLFEVLRRQDLLGREPYPDVDEETARATTSAPIASDTADCSSMASFAHRASGMTSVGLNAVALVNDR